MEKQNWTPGPWNIHRNMLHTWTIFSGDECRRDNQIGSVYQESDARLIASAPELYEALKRFVDFADKLIGASEDKYESALVRQAKAALRKATGE